MLQLFNVEQDSDFRPTRPKTSCSETSLNRSGAAGRHNPNNRQGEFQCPYRATARHRLPSVSTVTSRPRRFSPGPASSRRSPR
ncbi:hypothetical protein BMW22_13530 [Rhizobium leguminosarum]|uniref:Uncharacterized protein n=1 Tax=Rhizobium leguminosarum TaxID=384 RepID=A0A1L3ZA96_RHILE|nr:hypothetical protein BMW22_13530 [Rhizobium leguminosarum]